MKILRWELKNLEKQQKILRRVYGNYAVIASVVFVIQRRELIFYACYCTPLLLSFTGSHEMHVLCYPFKCGYLERTHAELSNAAQLLPKLSKL